jgi:site-specific DNA-methyltransferase (adenine-specific)
VTPYFQDDLVTLYLGDCTEVDAWLSADVLITDPPYGVAYVSNSSKYGSTDPIVADNDTTLRDAALLKWGGVR